MSALVDPGLCCQTVTVYQKRGQTVRRTVVNDACLSIQTAVLRELTGNRKKVSFSLILPREEPTLYPGDRILWGKGPKTVDWISFIPAAVPGLMEIEYVTPCYWDGEFSHWEAGA